MGAKQRIKEYLEIKGIKPHHFYRETGLSNGFLDSGSNINTDKLKIIIEIYSDLNLYWVIMGTGNMTIKNNHATSVHAVEVNEKTHEYQVKPSDFFEYLREKDRKIEELTRQLAHQENKPE